MFVMLFFEFLLDDAFHFKEAADLLRIKHGRQFVYILHSDALSLLLHFHLALGHGCGISAGAGLDGAFAASPQSAHFFAIIAIDGLKLFLLVGGDVQPINEFTHLSLIQSLIERVVIVFVCRGGKAKEHENHQYYDLFHRLILNFWLIFWDFFQFIEGQLGRLLIA